MGESQQPPNDNNVDCILGKRLHYHHPQIWSAICGISYFPVSSHNDDVHIGMYSMHVLFLLSRPASIHHQSLCILLVSVPKKKLFAKKGLQTIHIVSKSLKRPGTGPRSHHRLFRYVNVFACVTVICQHPSTIMVVAKVVGTEFQFASHSE